MTTQEAFNQAVELSNLNDPDLVTETVWLDWLTSLERKPYLVAARENPSYFGEEANSSTRATSSDSWDLSSSPGLVAAVSKLEVESIVGSVSGISTGDKVNVIDIREPFVEIAPRAYLRGKTVREYNDELQDDASNYVSRLKVFYSPLPLNKTATTDSLDLYDEHADLVVIPLAARLALRDQRPEEAQFLQGLLQEEWLNFILHLTVSDEVTVRELDRARAMSVRLAAQGVGN